MSKYTNYLEDNVQQACQKARRLEEVGEKLNLAQLERDFVLPREVILVCFRGRKTLSQRPGCGYKLTRDSD
jgi:hypothetical protein